MTLTWLPWRLGDAMPPHARYWVTYESADGPHAVTTALSSSNGEGGMIWMSPDYTREIRRVIAYVPQALPPPYIAEREA